MSGSRGEVIFGQTRAVKNYFLSFECVNFKSILVGPLKDVRKFCFQSGGGDLGYQKGSVISIFQDSVEVVYSCNIVVFTLFSSPTSRC